MTQWIDSRNLLMSEYIFIHKPNHCYSLPARPLYITITTNEGHELSILDKLCCKWAAVSHSLTVVLRSPRLITNDADNGVNRELTYR